MRFTTPATKAVISTPFIYIEKHAMHQSRRLSTIRSVVIALFITAFAHAVCAQGAKMLRVGVVSF